MDGHDRYTHADRDALPRLVSRLLEHCDCHSRTARVAGCGPVWPAGRHPRGRTRRIGLESGATYYAFEPRSRLVLSPHGDVVYSAENTVDSEGRGAFCRPVFLPDLACVDIEPWEPGQDGRPPRVPLPAGFRACRVHEGSQEPATFLVPAGGGSAAGVEKVQRRVPVPGPVRVASVPRAEFEGRAGPRLHGVARYLERKIARFEDEMCLGRLRRLGTAGEYVHTWGSTLGDLGEFVSSLNASRSPGLCLDTVLVNSETHDILSKDLRMGHGWRGSRPPHGGDAHCPNAAILGGVTFLQHRGIPHGVAFAVASAQAPVFVHGPTVLSCTEDSLEAFRHCGLEDPPTDSTGCPWGYRIRTVWDKSQNNVL